MMQRGLHAVALFAAVGLHAAVAADLDWGANRLIPLQKITVGPWDNYEAAVSPDEAVVYLTRDRNQIRTIYRQNIAAAETSLFIGEEGDAKNPVLDPAGQRLAFTFYGKDAQGDICIRELAGSNIECITDQQSLDESPVWVDAGHLAYLRRQHATRYWELVVYDTVSHGEKSVASGAISAPAASPDGRYLVYNRLRDDGSVVIEGFDRQAQQVFQPQPFALPGTTGHLAFSRDGAYVYFNHYLNDTNQDQVIDANDHSVIYRIPTQDWFAARQPLFPEQLTSVEYNCSQPQAALRYLYLTCAFEGSLDIYRLPLSGAVPAAWTEAQIQEAHLVARSHEDRLLLLNTLRYRTRRHDVAVLERLLSNHLEIGEFTAALYYLQDLTSICRGQGKDALADFYEVLRLIVKVRSSKQRVPVNRVTAEFSRLVAQTGREVHAHPGWQKLAALADAYLAYELEQPERALASLRGIALTGPLLPMERYLAFELYRRLWQEAKPNALLDLYPAMYNELSLSHEVRIYYAFNYLKLLGQSQSDAQARIQTLRLLAAEGVAGDAWSGVTDLFRAELASLELATTQVQEQQDVHFKQLSDLLKQTRDDVLLRKAMHIRAIQILGAAEQFKYMELLSRHWLVATNITEMEFANVVEQYAVVTMDKGYGMLAQGQLDKAYTTFYSAIRQTNDLEAHFQFITLGLDPRLQQRENLDKSYQLLNTQGLIGENDSYVQALRLLLPDAPDGRFEPQLLQRAEELLRPMRARGLNPGMRDLLLGYVYHQRLRQSRHGYGYDKRSFAQAHYHYMMALDLEKDNGRITAAVLENLGKLHLEVGQYALAADFLQQRLLYPFASLDAEVNLRWFLARASFYTNQPELAYEQSRQLLERLAGDNPLAAVFLEKTAFYAMQAQDYANAADLYRRLLTSDQELSPLNRARALLGYGFSLVKIDRPQEAAAALRQVLELTPRLSSMPADASQLLAFHPQRLQLLAYGLLAHLQQDPRARAELLRARIALLEAIAGKVDEYAYDEAGRLSLLAKDYQHLALAYEEAGSMLDMRAAMAQAVTTAEKWLQESAEPTGPVIYQTVLNYLSLAWLHARDYAGNIPENTLALVRKTLAALADQAYVSPLLLVQQAKLQAVVNAVQSKVLQRDNSAGEARLSALLQQLRESQVEVTYPEAYEQLQKLLAGLRETPAATSSGG